MRLLRAKTPGPCPGSRQAGESTLTRKDLTRACYSAAMSCAAGRAGILRTA